MTRDAHSNPNSGKRVPGRRRRTSDSGRCPSPGGQQRGRRSRRTAAAPRRTTAARPVLIHQGKPFRAAATFCQSAQAAGFTSEPCQNPLRHIKSSRSDKGAAQFTVTLVAEAAKVLTFEMAVAVAAMASVLLLDAEVNVEAACGSAQVILDRKHQRMGAYRSVQAFKLQILWLTRRGLTHRICLPLCVKLNVTHRPGIHPRAG